MAFSNVSAFLIFSDQHFSDLFICRCRRWPEVHQTQRRGPLRSARRERRRGTTGGSHEEDHGAGGYRGEGMGSMEPGDGSR